MAIKHLKVSAKPDSADPQIIQPSDWNAPHTMLEDVPGDGTGTGILYSEGPGFPIKAVKAGTSYQTYLRRKFNGSTNEAYEFVQPKEVYASDYLFTVTSPIGLTSGVLTAVTLSPVPLGLQASNPDHYIYLNNVVNPTLSEVVRVEGGTAVGGAASGTIMIRTVNNHAVGEWFFQSATCGIAEAMNIYFPGTIPVKVNMDYPGVMYGPVIVRNRGGVDLIGSGDITVYVQHGPNSANQTPFQFIHSTVDYSYGNSLRNINIRGYDRNNGLRTIDLTKQVGFRAQNININSMAWGINYADCRSCFSENMFVAEIGTTGTAYYLFDIWECTWQNCAFDGVYQDNVGYVCRNGGRAKLNNCTITRCSRAIWVKPVASGWFNHFQIVNSSITESAENAIELDATATGCRIIGFMFNGCRLYNNRKAGLRLIGGATVADGHIVNVMVNGCDISGNWEQGIYATGPISGVSPRIKYIIISNSMFGNNSEDGPTPLDAITFATDTFSLIVSGNNFANNDYDNPEVVGPFMMNACMSFSNGAFENLTVTNNTLVQTVVRTIWNTSTSGNQTFSGNTLVYTGGEQSFGAADVVDIPKDDLNKNILIIGTTPIRIINGGYYGRIIKLSASISNQVTLLGNGNIYAHGAFGTGKIQQGEYVTMIYHRTNQWYIISPVPSMV